MPMITDQRSAPHVQKLRVEIPPVQCSLPQGQRTKVIFTASSFLRQFIMDLV